MTSPPPPELVIAIVNWRTADLTIDCLRSISDEREDVPTCYVYVVDNGSGDGSAERIKDAIERHGWSRFVTLLPLADNLGFAAGNNAAIRAAFAPSQLRPEFVLLLNPDTVVRRGALRILLDFMRANPKVGIAGGRSEWPDAAPQDCCFNFPNALGEFALYFRVHKIGQLVEHLMPNVPIPQSPREIDWVSGAVMMIRTAVLDDIGLLDESYFLYYEETDFILRAKRAGWSCWHVPDCRVVHLVGRSSGITKPDGPPKRRPAYWFQSRTRYYAVNYGRTYAALADVLVAAALLGWKARRVLQRRSAVDPPHFLRDLLRHGAGVNFARRLEPRKIDL